MAKYDKEKKGGKTDKAMCKLVKDGFHVDSTKEFGKLVSKPGYFCRKCGRVAAAKKNLCKPETL